MRKGWDIDWGLDEAFISEAKQSYQEGSSPEVPWGMLLILGKTLADVEKATLVFALETNGWNGTAAAKSLGLPRSTFGDKIKKYGVTWTNGRGRKRSAR